jgi:hypothetical protein
MAETAETLARPDWRLGLARLAVGLAQGMALYGLSHAATARTWPATDGPLYAALLMALLFAPLVIIGGLGHLRRVTLALWFLAAVAIAAGLAGYGVATAIAPPSLAGVVPPTQRLAPDAPVFLAVMAFQFIAHHLIVPADARRRWLAPYPDYFDTGWLDAAKIGLALVFTGVLWLLLHLGAALFLLIGLKGFEETIIKGWFAIPVTAVAFAAGVHLADARVGLTRGLRTIGLFLLAWLTPLMTAIAVAFLIALIFTGLAPLWKAGLATGVLLGSMAALIILANAVYQDGAHDRTTPFVLRWSVRITAVVLVPLVVVAACGLALRIGQHGLTPQRITAAACILVGAGYALGYALAALTPGRWMRRLEPTNIAAAFLILALILALFTPIADPAPIAVADQVGRLERGTTAPAQFDYAFLRFRAGARGLAALRVLAAGRGGPRAAEIAADARRILKTDNPYSALQLQPPSVYPRGAAMPEGLAEAMRANDVTCGGPCEIYLAAPAADGFAEAVVNTFGTHMVFARTPGGSWSRAGDLNAFLCPEDTSALRAGAAGLSPPEPGPRLEDIMVGGRRLRVTPFAPYAPHPCAKAPAPPAPRK